MMKAGNSFREYRGQYDGYEEDDIHKDQRNPSCRDVLCRGSAQAANITKEVENDSEKQNRFHKHGNRPVYLTERVLHHDKHWHNYAKENGIGQHSKNSLRKLSFCGRKKDHILSHKREDKSKKEL
jgi:hypothetical protein